MADIDYTAKTGKNSHYLSNMRTKSNIFDSKVMHSWPGYKKVKSKKLKRKSKMAEIKK